MRAFTGYFTGDLSLQERLLGDPAMTIYIGGPETPEKIRERHERYLRGSGKGQMFVIVVGLERVAPAQLDTGKKSGADSRFAMTGDWIFLPIVHNASGLSP